MNPKSIPAQKSLRGIVFYFLATAGGLEDLRLERVGDRCFIAGKWKRLHQGPGSGDLPEDFANWESTPQGILRFTKKYGPLLTTPQEGMAFREPIRLWLRAQESYRTIWHAIAGAEEGKRSRPPDYRWPYSVTLKPGDDEWFHYGYPPGELSFLARTLEKFLWLTLWSLPLKRLKICRNPECKHLRYFIARDHLGQKYCSEECAKWGPSQSKRRWWAEHGAKWRADRHRSKRGWRRSRRKGR